MAKDDIVKCTKAYRDSAAFKRASFHTPDEIWSMFVDAEGFTDVVFTFKALVDVLSIDKDQNGQDLHGIKFYEALRSKLTSWKCQSLWDLLNARLKCSEYKHESEYVAKHMKCIIVGAGPIGLRTAVEMLMLGCQTVVVEKRKDFSRNNVLHLWPFLMADFRQLGAKKFCGKFGAGSIDHINIKTLQTILLKVALVFGVEIHPGVDFKGIVEPTDDHGWRVKVSPENYDNISKQDFNIIIGADGKKNVLPGFTQIEMRGSLAIGITCNFMNNNTPEEKCCKEISGISYQFKPAFFDELKEKHGVELENLVYYKDETHYFVMTARKSSLLDQKVFLKDFGDPSLLVQSSNINKAKLLQYTCNAVYYSTTLPKVEFKKLSNGTPDIALFDFTSLKKAENASRIIERKKHKLVMGLVGDSLIEPFWPTGSGCGRGVLSALDIAWMVRQFALNYPPLAILRERENVYKLLSASNHDNLQRNVNLYTIDPKTRYSSLDTKTVQNIESLRCLYDTDDMDSADMTLSSPVMKPRNIIRKKTAVDRRKSGSGTASRPSGRATAGKTKRKLERQESKDKTHRNEDAKQKLSIGDKKKFFEEHNQKMGGAGASKPKRPSLHGDQFSDLHGIDEDLHESDDDILVDKQPMSKKKVASQKSGSLKRQGSKENILLKRQGSKENIPTTRRGSASKRQASKESVKRQSSKDGQKMLKTMRRHSSTDEGESSGPLNDDVFSKQKVFQAKGGGLKSKSKNESKRLSEKSDTIKQKRRSTGDKKSTSVRKRSKKSVSNQDEINAAAGSSREKDVPVEPVDAKTFFSKWLEKLLPRLFTETSTTPPETFQHPKDVCAQVSVVPVMALSLLYNCNKSVRRKGTELRLKELIANANNRSNTQPHSSLEKNEAPEELSFIKAGSVRDSMAKWQKMAQKEEPTHNFYEFIKRTKKDTGVSGSDISDGILLVKHEHADFTPKDVIDVEEQLLADEEEERKRSPFAKMSTGGFPSFSEFEIRLALEQLSDQQSPVNAILMLQVLYNIHKRILDEPNVDKHYRIHTKGETFLKYVWRWEGAKTYFVDTGWIICGDFLVLSKSRPLDLVVKVIEDVFRRNRKIHLSHSGSISSQIEIVADGGELHSTIKEEEVFAINQEEIASTYTNIDVPTEGDSSIGSGIDDDDLVVKPIGQKPPLQRVQSKEHNMGDEAYIVVDFVNETSSGDEQQFPMDTIEEGNEKGSRVIDTVQITDDEIEICEIQIKNDSPFTTLNRSFSKEENEFTKDEGEFTLVSAHPGGEVETDDDTMTITTWSVVADNKNKSMATQPEPIVQNVDNITHNNKIKSLKRQNVIETDMVMEDAKTGNDFNAKESKDAGKKVKSEKKGKKKVFAVGHGLKKDKKGSGLTPVTNDTSKTEETCDASPTSLAPLDRSTPIRSSPKKEPSTINSVNSEISVTSPSSIVKQNTQLFDQQIANNLKTRYTTPQEVLIPRLGSVGKAGVTAVDKSLFEKEGVKERSVTSPTSPSGEFGSSGKVSGARSLFERGSINESVAPLSPKSSISDAKCTKEDSVETNNVKEVEEAGVAEIHAAIVTNPVHDIKTVNKKKKKNPFKKNKHKDGKNEKNNKTNVALVGDNITHTNKSYDERPIDVVEITSLIDTFADAKPKQLSTDVTDNNDVSHAEISLSDDVKLEPACLNPNTNITQTKDDEDGEIRRSKSVAEKPKSNEDDDIRRTSSFVVNRNSKKRPRLAKKRGTDTLISADEEILKETLVTDVATTDLSFDKLGELDAADEIASENPSKDIMEVHVDRSIFTRDSKAIDVMEVHVDTSIFTRNIKPIEVDVNSLNNESCIDEHENVISAQSCPIISVTESDTLNNSDTKLDKANEDHHGDVSSIMDEMNVPSETTASFYDGDDTSMELSVDMENSMGAIEDESKKKKKKFPFRISLGKKEKHKKPKLTSSDNVFVKDTNVEASYSSPKKKKKSKSKNSEISASSAEGVPSISSSTSIPSPSSHDMDIDDSIHHGQDKEKVKSKKLQFFKKKKSGSSTPTLQVRHHSFSSKQNENELNVNGNVIGRSISTPTSPMMSNHNQTNGHTNHDNVFESVADRLI